MVTRELDYTSPADLNTGSSLYLCAMEGEEEQGEKEEEEAQRVNGERLKA